VVVVSLLVFLGYGCVLFFLDFLVFGRKALSRGFEGEWLIRSCYRQYVSGQSSKLVSRSRPVHFCRFLFDTCPPSFVRLSLASSPLDMADLNFRDHHASRYLSP